MKHTLDVTIICYWVTYFNGQLSVAIRHLQQITRYKNIHPYLLEYILVCTFILIQLSTCLSVRSGSDTFSHHALTLCLFLTIYMIFLTPRSKLFSSTILYR